MAQLTFMVSVPQVGRSLVIASGASEIAAAEMPGLCPMTMRCADARADAAYRRQDVIRPPRDTAHRRPAAVVPRRLTPSAKVSAVSTRARRGAREDQVGREAAFLEAPRHLQRLVMTLAAQRTLEVANVGCPVPRWRAGPASTSWSC